MTAPAIGEQLAELGYVEVPRLTIRRQLAQLLRPARSRQRDRLLERYRWANAGLRDRLAELTEELTDARERAGRYAEEANREEGRANRNEAALDAITALVDEQARTIGHAHPAVIGVRAIVAEARVR